MDTTKLSSKGQVIIPVDVRLRHRWKPGQEFEVLDTEEGVLLKPRSPFPKAKVDDIGASLQYTGPKLPVERLGIDAIPYTDEEDDGDSA